MAEAHRNFAPRLHPLERHYMILDDDGRVQHVLAENAGIFSLLTEAVNPLRVAFGESRPMHVRVQDADDDILLKVAVQLPTDFPDPEAALQSFDNEWWLHNCHRSNGTLLFDYELRDAV